MIIYYCLTIVLLMPITLALGSIPFRIQQCSAPDFEQPREQAAQLIGAGARIVHAQKNAWEALIIFTVALFIASQNAMLGDAIVPACIVFVVARLCHAFFYLIGKGILRFLSFLAGLGAALWIVGVSIF